jgi:hypothetical protein
MDTAAYLTEKATQCRRLAAAVNDDRAVEVLLALAEKFETRAERTAREGSEKADQSLFGADLALRSASRERRRG